MNVAPTLHRPELIQVADAVAREKGIDREEVLDAMEHAIQKAGRSKYGQELDVRASINRTNGEILLARYREVAEEIEDEGAQITPEHAAKIDPNKKIGEFIIVPLPPIDFGRIAAQTAKQVIVQKVREAERGRQYEEYKDRVSEVVHGVVKRVEFGHVMVDLGRAEAIVRRDELIPRENFRQGDRIRAYIHDVRQEQRGPQIFLSRTFPQFMAKLFTQEVPEIYDGIIEIRAVARDPGSRAKIAVISNDSSIDPVGACVGMRGSRVQAVVQELQGEKIDIIPWSADHATFVVNALAPAEVTKVVLDEDSGTIEVVVPDEQQSLAIGRRGQNVRLASQLTGWHIDILTEEAESARRQEEFRSRSAMFIEALDVDDVIAHLLVTEGFSTIEEVAFVPLEDLMAIEAFDEDIAEALRERACDYLERRDADLTAKRKSLGVKDAIAEIEGLSPAMLVQLGEAGVREIDDLADLSTEELRFIVMSKEVKIAPDDLGHVKEDRRARLIADQEPAEDGKIDLTLNMLNYLKPHKLTSSVQASALDNDEAEAIVMSARKIAGWLTDEDLTDTADDCESGGNTATE
ncbi:MAG: transcription termination factor NusA [Rhodospirillaceae bacterium]|nr:transcription termination factor NusA [Rhodospirillaceae bacterium]